MKAQILQSNFSKAEMKVHSFISETVLMFNSAFRLSLKRRVKQMPGIANKRYLSALSYYVFNILKESLRENFLGSETEMEFIVVSVRRYAAIISKTIGQYSSARAQKSEVKNSGITEIVINDQKQAA